MSADDFEREAQAICTRLQVEGHRPPPFVTTRRLLELLLEEGKLSDELARQLVMPEPVDVRVSHCGRPGHQPWPHDCKVTDYVQRIYAP